MGFHLLGVLMAKLRKIKRNLKSNRRYQDDYQLLSSQNPEYLKIFPFGKPFKCLNNWDEQGGVVGGHYFHQDLLVARIIFSEKPSCHIDVGSRIDGFVAHVASFREIEVFDIRPLDRDIAGIKFVQFNLMDELPDSFVACCDSLSCLHALEHFGLGRYGDPVAWNGHLVGLSNLTKMLKSGGTLYLSVPLGEQRIEFNAHRVFSAKYLLECVQSDFEVGTCSVVDDAGALHMNVSLDSKLLDNNFDCDYGCIILQLTKR